MAPSGGGRVYGESCTNAACEGTPAESSRKSMYQPGGAMLPPGGRVSDSVPPAPAQAGCGAAPHSPTSRCSMSNACVTDPGLISTAEAIGDVLVYETDSVDPYRSG